MSPSRSRVPCRPWGLIRRSIDRAPSRRAPSPRRQPDGRRGRGRRGRRLVDHRARGRFDVDPRRGAHRESEREADTLPRPAGGRRHRRSCLRTRQGGRRHLVGECPALRLFLFFVRSCSSRWARQVSSAATPVSTRVVRGRHLGFGRRADRQCIRGRHGTVVRHGGRPDGNRNDRTITHAGVWSLERPFVEARGSSTRSPCGRSASSSGIVVGIALMVTIMERIQDAAGVAVSAASFIAVAAIYVLLWTALYLAFRGVPRILLRPSQELLSSHWCLPASRRSPSSTCRASSRMHRRCTVRSA